MDDRSPNVVSLFDRKKQAEPIEAKPSAVIKASPAADGRSVTTLNSVMEAVLKGEATGVCVIATGPSGIGRYWLSFPAGKDVQVEATRYIGLLHLYEDILKEVARCGVEDDSPDEPGTAA